MLDMARELDGEEVGIVMERRWVVGFGLIERCEICGRKIGDCVFVAVRDSMCKVCKRRMTGETETMTCAISYIYICGW